MTFVYDDHYVTQPAFQFWSRESYMDQNGGQPVDEEFEYNSATNTEWLSPDQLRGLIGLAG